MTNQVSLLAYLQETLPTIPTAPLSHPEPNTTDDVYSHSDIKTLTKWDDFNLTHILDTYQDILLNSFLPADPFPDSPLRTCHWEWSVRMEIRSFISSHMRRSLRAAFAYLDKTDQMKGRTDLSFDIGQAAQTIDDYVPDLSFYVLEDFGDNLNRAPGSIKASWKWDSGMRYGTPDEQREYRQALSKVNWYMIQHGTRYGLILTDQELVGVRRRDDKGNLELSRSIPWDCRGSRESPKLTVLLALWYIGMLAAVDEGPKGWGWKMSEPKYLERPEVPEWIVEKCAVPPQAVDLEGLLPEEIVFNWRLSKGEYSCLFIVTIRDSTCLLKVHHGRGPKESYESPDRETNLHTCEATAYRRLKQHGLCKDGIVPRFYGTIDHLDPKLHLPHLKPFLKDEYPPKGILLEYIPHMKQLLLSNYTKERMNGFIRGMERIHLANVEHSDVYPRNMMVLEHDPSRVVWIDFDRAQTFHPGNVSDRQKEWLDLEAKLVDGVGRSMEADSKEGRVDNTALLYY